MSQTYPYPIMKQFVEYVALYKHKGVGPFSYLLLDVLDKR